MARLGQGFFAVIVLGQIAMVLLAAPAATAGTFCLEQARGHVRLMLITEVTSLDIVLGVLAARLLPVLGGVACVVPVLAIASTLGGIPPSALVELVAVTAGTATLGCSLALALSIGARRLHEVLVATYVLLAGWALGYPVLSTIRLTPLGGLIHGSWMRWLLDVNPFWLAMAPVLRPGSSRPEEIWTFLVGTLALSAVLVGLAAWRLRPAAVNDRGPSPRRVWRRALSFGRSRSMLDAHPVFWRECHLHHPTTWIGVLCGLYVAGALLFSVLAVVECAGNGARAATAWAGPFNGFQAAVGLLLLSLVTPTSLAEERAWGSLEVLLSTPLSSRGIILGKWMAHYRVVPWMAVLPGIVAIAHAIPTGRWSGVLLLVATVLAQGAAVTSLGITLAIWVPRLDRALTLSAAIAVFFTVPWIPLMFVLCRGNKILAMGLASASPLFGIGLFTNEIVEAPPEMWGLRMGWMVLWIFVYGTISLSLLGAALATFDACLGRIRPAGPRPGRFGDCHGLRPSTFAAPSLPNELR